MITLEDFTIQSLQGIEKFTTEWRSHRGDPNWPDEMELEEWSEHLAVFLLQEELNEFKKLEIALNSST